MLSGSAKQLTSVVHTRTDRQRGKFGRVCCLLYNRTCPLFTVRVFWIRISPPTEFSCADLGLPGWLWLIALEEATKINSSLFDCGGL
jgi:hypothetical protein